MAKPPRFGATEPLQVFQDDFFYHPENMTSHALMPAPMKQQRKPLQPSNCNVILNPPHGSSAKPSPFKSNSRTAGQPLTPLKPSHGNKLNMVHVMAPTSQPRSTDSLEKKQPPMSRFKTVAQKPVPEVAVVPKKEKVHQTIYPAPPAFNIALETYCPKPQGKRALLDAAPIKELRPVKKPRSDDSPLPPHDSFPPIVDDGSKPGHSYAQLIGMAILRSAQRRLTLAQIYKWISDNFSFYSAQDAGWQNSIRHNLSLNKHFIKQERPKDDPGKGNYWAIEPGMEHLFMKEKPSRKPATTAENLPVMSTRLEPSQPPLPIIQEPIQTSHFPVCQNSLPPLPPPSSQEAPAARAPDVSSDATIAVSDAADADDVAEKSVEGDIMNDSGLYSPLPVAMHSSPPIPRHLDVHSSGTPPPMQRPLGSSPSKSRSHKRKFASMDDSGYISSLESSAMRPQHQERLTSEADRPRIKRGRAEEEIARLRASSYDSPTKGRSWNGYAPPSSSPLRQLSSNDCGQMLPPLTPAMKLKAPQKPPPSVSPSTNLRLHRESVQSMIDSPYRRVASILPRGETMIHLTPGFNVDEVFYGIERKPDDHNPDFDIFQDGPFAPMFALSPVAANGSPTKRSAKRQRLDRSHSTSALNETSNTAYNSLSASSFLRVPGYGSGLGVDTPSKIFDGLPSSPSKLFSMQSPSKMPATAFADTENIAPWISMDDLCSPEFLEDNDFSGIDMLAGFEKIGSNNPQPARSSRQSQKPGLGRSYTTTF